MIVDLLISGLIYIGMETIKLMILLFTIITIVGIYLEWRLNNYGRDN